jgi:hypothetical protein
VDVCFTTTPCSIDFQYSSTDLQTGVAEVLV